MSRAGGCARHQNNRVCSMIALILSWFDFASNVALMHRIRAWLDGGGWRNGRGEYEGIQGV